MTNPASDSDQVWLIKKDGFYYRPNRQGYTKDATAAGRYTRAEADREAAIEPWHMSVEHEPEPALDVVAVPSKTTLEVRRDESGQLDEIVATGASLHVEQMGGNTWWMSIEAGGRLVHVTFTTPRTIISGRCEDVSDGRSTETRT